MTPEITTEEEAREAQMPHVSRFYKTNHDSKYCCAGVHDGGRSVGFHQCCRKPKHWYGSLGYCTQHDPNNVLHKKAESAAKYEAERKATRDMDAARKRAEELADECVKAVQLIAGGHNSPRTFCAGIISRYSQSKDKA